MDATVAKVETALEVDGAVYRFTENALEEGPSGSGLDAAGMRAALGMATADMDTQLDAILAAASPSGGIYTQTVTVVDADETPIPNADVYLYSGAVLIDLDQTDANGIAEVTCDAAPAYTLAVRATGYTSYSASLAVTESATLDDIELTAITFTPSTEPDSVTVRWCVMDEDGQPCGAGEGTVRIRIHEGPGTDGFAWDKNERTDTTDASGYVEFANVPVGATIRAKLGASSTGGQWYDIEIPSDATSPYDPTEIVGTVP
jgi:hypothetical protein